MKLSTAAATVIALARAIRAYWEVELPKRHPDYPIIHMDEESTPPPSEEAKLREYLTGLPTEMVYQLILIMHIGRGDFGTVDLAEQFEQMKTTFSTPAWAISQMMGKASLANYLTDGLDKLKRSRISVDKLFAKASKAGK